jgi:hypothetical protein
MGCQENEYLVNNSNRPDWMRKEALYNLIRDGCIDALWQLINNSNRPDWIRYTALDAIIGFARLSSISFTDSSLTIHAGGNVVTLNTVSISVSSLGPQSADYLYELANNSNRPDKMRKIAVETLVDIRHSQYCLAIADNSNRPDWMRKLAMMGL